MERIPAEAQTSGRSFGDLIAALVQQTSGLIRVELALIQSGIYEKLRVCASAIWLAVLGMALGFLGLMALLAAGIIALAAQVGVVVSALGFAVVLIVPALFLMRRGFRQWSRHAGRWE